MFSVKKTIFSIKKIGVYILEQIWGSVLNIFSLFIDSIDDGPGDLPGRKLVPVRPASVHPLTLTPTNCVWLESKLGMLKTLACVKTQGTLGLPDTAYFIR